MWFLSRKKTPIKTAVEVKTKARPDEDLLKKINSLQSQLESLKFEYAKTTGHTFEPESAVKMATQQLQKRDNTVIKSEMEKVLEGVFDGQSMIGADGEQYDVPANYASKSKLVEGDILKLTINHLGAFVYKQIQPIGRRRMVGVLTQDPQNMQYYAESDGKKWRLLTASVTYFKGESGDEIVFLIPAEAGSRWAAVENIVRK